VQGFRQQALAVSTDPEHRFELALQLGDMKIAHQLATEAEVRTNPRTHAQHTHTHTHTLVLGVYKGMQLILSHPMQFAYPNPMNALIHECIACFMVVACGFCTPHWTCLHSSGAVAEQSSQMACP